MKNVINFHELWAEKNRPTVHKGYEIIKDQLSEEDASNIMDYMMFTILYEIRTELGINELTEEQEKVYEERGLGKLYQQINAVYKEAAGSCYFCDKDVDPNEEFPESPRLCMICGKKMHKFLIYMGKERLHV